MVEREPITVVVSEKGWIRALRGHVTDLSERRVQGRRRAEIRVAGGDHRRRCLVFATNGRFYTLDAAKLPGGRGHGEPVRLLIDLEQEAELVAVFRPQGGRKFLVASDAGPRLRRARGRMPGQYPQGQAGAQCRRRPMRRARSRRWRASWSPSIGENRKLVIFPLEQVPEMARGRGVRLQRYKDGGLCDLKTFEAEHGLSWTDAAGRAFSLTLRELADWRGNRADAGRLAPKGFPRSNTFSQLRATGNGEGRSKALRLFCPAASIRGLARGSTEPTHSPIVAGCEALGRSDGQNRKAQSSPEKTDLKANLRRWPSRAEAEDAVRTLIRWAGDDPAREGLRNSRSRRSCIRGVVFGLLRGSRDYLKRTFEEVAGYDEIVLLRDIRFESHCEHHIAPIIGRVHIGYLPRQRVVGISKLVRLVDVYSKRLQVQEKMTAEIAACLDSVLKPFGVGVVVEAAHECMTTRGVHKPEVTMVTSCMLGSFRTKAATRQEFLSAINLKGGSSGGHLMA